MFPANGYVRRPRRGGGSTSVRTLLAAVAVAGALAAVAPAVAGAFTADVTNGQLHYTAAAGEANNLTLTADSDFFHLSDPNALITHGPGCIKGSPSHTVTCGVLSVNGAVIQLGDLNDTLTVGAFPFGVVAHGQGGNDTFHGGPHGDSLFGDAGADTLDGRGGTDVQQGGTGFDTADYSARSLSVFVRLDTLPNDGEAGEQDNVGSDVERILGGSAGDLLEGDNNPNTLIGNDGRDFVHGLGGADVLNGGPGLDRVIYDERTSGVNVSLDGIANDGAPGENDNATGDEEIVGGAGGDTLTGNSAANALIGNGGDDKLHGLAGSDDFDGGPGADVVDGGDGAHDSVSYGNATGGVNVSLDGVANDGQPGEGDQVNGTVEDVFGTNFADHLIGSDKPNILNGLGGNDTTEGKGGNDLIFGDVGNDTLTGGLGNDLLQGGSQTDTVSYADHTAGVKATIGGKGVSGTETDTIVFDVENLTGGSGPDTLVGDNNSNTLDGGAGNDHLIGNALLNTLIGGPGVDTIEGGTSTDFIQALDGEADHIFCSQFDQLTVDPIDILNGC